MSLIELKDRLLAIPWVYDIVRPLVVGGIDYEAFVRFCQVGEKDRVFDFGCGTARVLKYLRCAGYLGVDLDLSALERARKFATENIRFMQGDSWEKTSREFNPTMILMIGVVHHLSDEIFQTVISRLSQAIESQPIVVTIDVSFFKGCVLNNFFSCLDRGRYVRRPEEYEGLFQKSGLHVIKKEVIATRLGYVRYVGYHLGFKRGSESIIPRDLSTV